MSAKRHLLATCDEGWGLALYAMVSCQTVERVSMSEGSSRKTSLIYADHSPLADVVRVAERMAASDATVLLTGETGTGKEVFAKFLHEASHRSKGEFVPVNCGAIPENLMEAELFGHVRGAFTGAQSARKGRVAMAHEGTLFLDEIGEMPLALQVKLLRLLQEQTYEPVGSAQTVHANFRLVAATNRDLAQEVEAGRFRRDLYYRLYVCPLELPALRARPSDIRPLIEFFWKARGETRSFSGEVFDLLEKYHWPGNIRELENLVERLSVCTINDTVHITDLPHLYRAYEESGAAPSPVPGPFPSDPAFPAVPMAPHEGHTIPPPHWPTQAPPVMPVPIATPPGAFRMPTDEQDLPWLKPASEPPVQPVYAQPDGAPPFAAPRSAPYPSQPGPDPHIPPPADNPSTPPMEPSFPFHPDSPYGAAPDAHPPVMGESPPSYPPAPAPAPTEAYGQPAAPPSQPAAAPAPQTAAAPPADARPSVDTTFPLLPENPEFPLDLPDLLRSIEDHYIDAALAQADGNKQAAANMLSLRRTTLVEKIRRRETRSAKEAARRQKDDKKGGNKGTSAHK